MGQIHSVNKHRLLEGGGDAHERCGRRGGLSSYEQPGSHLPHGGVCDSGGGEAFLTFVDLTCIETSVASQVVLWLADG